MNHIYPAPFYNFILDHPLYHHTTLDFKLKNYYAFSIDENHCKYIQNFYPHIKAVYQVALGAENVISLENLQEKKKSILIMGTYRNPDIYMKQIYNMNSIFFIAQSFYSTGVRIAAQPPPLAIVTLIESPFETITSSVLKSDA